MLLHAPERVACWGCDQKFRTTASMFTHLESGTCQSLADISSLNNMLASWWYNRSFILAPFRNKLISGEDMGTGDDVVRPFVCRSCDAAFGRYSSLVHHIELGFCEQDLAMLKLEELELVFGIKFA